MLLREADQIPDAALPLDACKAHLRLGVGFSDDGGQDGLILRYLRAAISTVEARTSKVLLERDFRMRLSAWKDAEAQSLPVAPVTAILSVAVVGRDGTATMVELSRYRLEQDLHRPTLRPTGWTLPSAPAGGAVEVEFRAGFGPDWQAVPSDLAHAVMLLTAQYHEYRQPGDARGQAMPFDVAELLGRWRVVRGLGGRT